MISLQSSEQKHDICCNANNASGVDECMSRFHAKYIEKVCLKARIAAICRSMESKKGTDKE